MSDETTAPEAADLDFSAYLAARREVSESPVVVKVNDRALTFKPVRRARPLLDIAVNGNDDNTNTSIISAFYQDSLSADDHTWLLELAADPASGFDQDAFFTLFRRVNEVINGRPTMQSSGS